MTDTSENIGISESELKRREVKEIPVIQDHGFFVHKTGDTYEGLFEIRKKDHIVKMHGAGVYTTAEGDIYTGVWDNDKLGAGEMVTIVYKDGSRYEGTFKDWCYTGYGKYVYPDESYLSADFADNCPVGVLRLTDPNEHPWIGKAEQGFGWVNPINHYFEMLEKPRDSPKVPKSKAGKNK